MTVPTPATANIRKFVPQNVNQQIEKIEADEAMGIRVAKRPFKKTPHLTDRPFKANAALLKLRDEMEQKRRRSSRVNIKKS